MYTDYKRDSSSPFVSRNHCFHNLSKMADWSKRKEKKHFVLRGIGSCFSSLCFHLEMITFLHVNEQ